MRLIDADALIEFIDVGHLRHPSELVFSELDVVNMLNHAPTIEPQKWIPITEAEPGAAHVLATLRWDEDDYEVTEMDYHAIVAAQGDKDKVISAGAKNIIKHLIAWMPLPKPYKEEE